MDDEEKIVLTSKNLFPSEITREIFNLVKSESAIAQLIPAEPIPYVGKTEWIMTLDGEASVVDEGAAKPAQGGEVTPKVIKPFKVVYQMRVTDEFMKMSDEQRIPFMEQFQDGFARKIRRALDITAIHGLDPATTSKLSFYNKCLDKLLQGSDGNDRYYYIDKDNPIDAQLKNAVSGVTSHGYKVNGVIFSPDGAEKMGELTKSNGDYKYPQFDFAFPDTFAGGKCVMGDSLAWIIEFRPDEGDPFYFQDLALVGDFDAMRWGYAQDVTFDVIETGDPDGQGDLKRYNQVVLRAEAYIGFGVLDEGAFGLVGQKTPDESESESESN